MKKLLTIFTIAALAGSVIFSPAPAQAESGVVASCQWVEAADGNFDIAWPSTPGVTKFVLYRTVNGNGPHWRDVVIDPTATTMEDSSAAGTVVYSVETQNAGGVIGTTTCTETDGAIASCQWVEDGDGFDIGWPTTAGATKFVLYRIVNGGGPYWRKVVQDPAATTMDDTAVAGTVVYSVESKNGNTSLGTTTCTEGDGVVDACKWVEDANGDFEITWPTTAGVTKFVLYRTVDGAGPHWRAAIEDDSATTMSDSAVAGTVVYSVETKNGNNALGTTTCTEASTKLIAVGDMAKCTFTNGQWVGIDGTAAVSTRIAALDGKILALGDLVYDDGTDAEFEDCYDQYYGDVKDRTLPVVGNHEYGNGQANDITGYWDYFMSQGTFSNTGVFGEPRVISHDETVDHLYYQDISIPGWQIIVADTECYRLEEGSRPLNGCDATSIQYEQIKDWMEAANAANPNVCRIVALHKPLVNTSGSGNPVFGGPLSELVELLYAGGTDLVMAGHTHKFESFDPTNATPVLVNGVQGGYEADATNGYEQLVIGTGGRKLETSVSNTRAANSVFLQNTEYGVVSLDLAQGSYSWEFIKTDGTVMQQNGLDIAGGRDCVSTKPAVIVVP